MKLGTVLSLLGVGLFGYILGLGDNDRESTDSDSLNLSKSILEDNDKLSSNIKKDLNKASSKLKNLEEA